MKTIYVVVRHQLEIDVDDDVDIHHLVTTGICCDTRINKNEYPEDRAKILKSTLSEYDILLMTRSGVN